MFLQQKIKVLIIIVFLQFAKFDKTSLIKQYDFDDPFEPD